MTLDATLMILVTHFIADFILQKDSWAQNKASSLMSLGLHVFTYSVALWIIVSVFTIYTNVYTSHVAVLSFVLTNLVAHFITDFWSSRKMKSFVNVLWRDETGIRMHWTYPSRRKFFIILGVDQLLHYGVLFASYQHFFN